MKCIWLHYTSQQIRELFLSNNIVITGISPAEEIGWSFCGLDLPRFLFIHHVTKAEAKNVIGPSFTISLLQLLIWVRCEPLILLRRKK